MAKRNEPPDHPYLCANEWVGTCLALLSGFPAMPIAQLAWDGITYVAWPFLEQDQFEAGVVGLSHPAFRSCANHTLIPYQVAALDAWIANPDRHIGGNVLVVRDRVDLLNMSPQAVLSDHDRSCFGIPWFRGQKGLAHLTKDYIDDWVQRETAWLREDADWRDGVLDRAHLDDAIDACMAVSASDLKGAVEACPSAWLDDGDRKALMRFLEVRQHHLKDIVQKRLGRFPNLH
jgi:hypothetical protein